MTDFEGVVPALAAALTNRGYDVLTPVQTAVLVPELRDSDLLVSAQTGSGKTVAFGLNIAHTLLNGADHFDRAGAPLALVVAPTRELALQVQRELAWLYEKTGARSATCIGGMDSRSERRTLDQGAQIVVGTPGRLRDHITRGNLNTKSLRAVVLDEADEMLDLGFREDLEFILGAAPSERRTLMFSATVPRTIANLAKRYQRDAVRVSTAEEREQHVDIDYRALTVAANDKENAIVNVLRYFDAKNALVFCSTRASVNHMTSRFSNRGFSVVALSGELSQNERTHALQAMRDGRAKVCIATDVAARGIDLPNLELVIHADLPKNPEILLHRSGRTGRAGRKGVCALIVPKSAGKRTQRLLDTAGIEATWAKPPSVDEVVQRDRERILADPALSEPLSEDEKTFAVDLLSRHSAEQVAAAFLRQHLAGQSAPEELIDAPVENFKSDRSAKIRDDFANGVWFSLSVGRKQNAEPRWLLPMLCKAGGMSKGDIGAIKIHQTETHVEVRPERADGFFDAIGPDHTLEKTIVVKRMDGTPKAGRDKTPRARSSEKTWSPRDKPANRGSSTNSGPSSRGAPEGKFKKPYKSRKAESARPSTYDPDAFNETSEREKPRFDKPKKEKTRDEFGKKKKPKKPHKKKLAALAKREAAKGHGGGNAGSNPLPGSSPLKRTKPKSAD
jgi:ATP-dependent RNA helicase DeaD